MCIRKVYNWKHAVGEQITASNESQRWSRVPSLRPRLSPLKTGGGERLVTFARKAVDFARHQRDQTSGPLAHPINCLSPTIERYSVPERSVLSLQFVHSTAVKVNAYKIFTCSRGFVLQSDWVRQIQAPEVNSFSRECYQALSSPRF